MTSRTQVGMGWCCCGRKANIQRFLSWGRETVLGAEGREGKLGTSQELQGCPLHGPAGVEGP